MAKFASKQREFMQHLVDDSGLDDFSFLNFVV